MGYSTNNGNDMNLQPFDIKLARQGVPVRTSDGRRARIVCWDMAASTHPIVALVTDEYGEEHVEYFTNSGHNGLDLADGFRSLMLCPDDAPAQKPPRTWQEFSMMYPIKAGEAYIDGNSRIISAGENTGKFRHTIDRNWCTSTGEAEAFLALMQLRQLRKAWVGDWEITDQTYYCIISSRTKITVIDNYSVLRSLSFPTKEMAEDFLSCFRDLCETAKRLL